MSGYLYTEDDFKRMETDPAFLRQYYWQVGQRALLRSVSRRRENLAEAQREARFGLIVLELANAQRDGGGAG